MGQPVAAVSTRAARPAGRRRSWWCGSSAATGTGRAASTGASPAGCPPRAERRAGRRRRVDRPSTVAAGIAVQAHIYLAHGGIDNLRQLHAFLSDTVLMTGFGFAPPVATPTWGTLERRPTPPSRRSHDRRAVLPRAAPGRQHRLRRGACAAPSKTAEGGRCRSTARPCAPPNPNCCDALGAADAMVVTVLAAGGAKPADGIAGGDDDSWNVEHLAALDIPILQGLCLTSPARTVARQRRRAQPARRRHSGRGARIRRPHHHGSVLVQRDRRRRADLLCGRPRTLRPGRGARACATRGCVTSPPPTSEWRWCSRPIRPSTPASATPSAWTPRPARSRCYAAMRERGYQVGDLPGVEAGDGDALIHALIERGGQDPDWLTEESVGRQPDPGVRPATTATGSPPCPPNSPTR